MSKESILVGLEIGTWKICAVVAETRSDGLLKILGVGQAPSRGVRKGEIVDFETAQKCIREALVDAESKSDVEIASAWVGVTGAHINSFNNRGTVLLPEDRDEIDDQDIEDVKLSAREVSLAPENHFLHNIIQHYCVDGKEGIVDPAGMIGSKLEADYHIVYGVGNRLRNTIRCVREIPLEVEDVVLNGLASAFVVLTPESKQHGTLMIDIGAGTIDWVVFYHGVVVQSGVLAVGGDHITNDIAMGLRLPTNRAERLKIEEGSALLGNSLPGDTIVLQDETGFAGREVERELLNTIIHMRVREAFELLKRQLEQEPYLERLGEGVLLTGGTSLLRGIEHLASDVFGLPTKRVHAMDVSGVTSAFLNPQYSTAIGLAKYGQAVMRDRVDPSLGDRVMGGIENMGNAMKRLFARKKGKS